MNLQIKVTAAIVNQRVARKGEEKGEVKHSVQFFGVSEDGIPAQFACYGVSSHAEAEALAAKYPAGTNLKARNIPRDAYFVDPSELSTIPSGK